MSEDQGERSATSQGSVADQSSATSQSMLGTYLAQVVGAEGVHEQEPMREHTTFKVGGPADYFVTPHTEEELRNTIALCKREGEQFFVLGKGSDLLVSDSGYRGVIICLADEFHGIEVEENGDSDLDRPTDGIAGGSNQRIVGDTNADGSTHTNTEVVRLHCLAGTTLKEVSDEALELGLTGFEFACGIPGSVGGACFMNAGAYDGQIADVLESVRAIMPNGSFQTIDVADLALGYRTSRIRTEGLVVVSATFALHRGNKDEIAAKIADLTQRRESKQPLEYGSAGSTFKRPTGYFVGKLVTDAGLRGYRVGDACVSTKHAGFVINLGHATAADVHAVIEHVQAEVKRQFGVSLEPEVRFLG